MTDTEHDLFERMAREIYREFENRPKYAQAQMNGVIAEECAAAALAVAKPMIERSMLNDMIDFFKGRSRDVAIYVRARGIDLEAKSVADSVSRRADLNCEPSGEPLQNGLQPLSEVARLRELLGGFVKNRAHITAGELAGVLDRLMDMSAAALSTGGK